MQRLFGWMLALAIQGSDGYEPTDRLIPPGWQGNPWGPVATKARETGQLPPLTMTPLMTGWDRWGRATLHDGDIVFRRGDARIAFGWFPFSRFIANASGSAYSHVGTVVIENGECYVYDTTKAGVRRQPFYVWVLDNVGDVGVKRLKPEYQSHVPEVVAYLHRTYDQQVPFDYALDLDDRALYCVEMAEKAFRSAGLKLSDPIRLRDMENASRFPLQMFLLQKFSAMSLEKPLSFDQRVFFPGNTRHGIWSSPLLETVYPLPEK